MSRHDTFSRAVKNSVLRYRVYRRRRRLCCSRVVEVSVFLHTIIKMRTCCLAVAPTVPKYNLVYMFSLRRFLNVERCRSRFDSAPWALLRVLRIRPCGRQNNFSVRSGVYRCSIGADSNTKCGRTIPSPDVFWWV
jgi:hypothetical protein